jgi:hypothetical protein
MLTTVDLHNEMRGVTSEVDDVPLDPDLSAEMRIADGQTMTQVPPKPSLSLGWCCAHLARELALRRRRD